MASRALIIAIENYPSAEGGLIAETLPGTLRAAVCFRRWLRRKWRAEKRETADTQMLFCSEPKRPYGMGATHDDIITALRILRNHGQNATDELYVFFSGHGFSFVKDSSQEADDVLVASDFRSQDFSSHCCFQLDKMIRWLLKQLGPGCHYHFIDACRNELTIEPKGSMPNGASQATGDASVFVLQSALPGAVTLVGGPFAEVLLKGLYGKGKAKTWNPNVNDAMFVRYASLRNYVQGDPRLSKKVYVKSFGNVGEDEAVLAVLRPIPMSTCTIEIRNAAEPVIGEVLYRRGRWGAEQRRPITGPRVELKVEPDDYAVSVRLDQQALDPEGPIQVELYDSRPLQFRRTQRVPVGAGIADLASVMLTEVDVVVPLATKLRLRHVITGVEQVVERSERIRLNAGRYLAALEKPTRASSTVDPPYVFLRKEVEFTAGERHALNLTDWRTSAPHAAIADRLPTDAGGIWFSESLGGPVADPDLDLWLALLGAGRINPSSEDFTKLSVFPLHDFSQEEPGAAPIYLLAGFSNPDTVLRAALTTADGTSWITTVQPSGLRGIRACYLPTSAGAHLVSLHVPGESTYTFASFSLPNRATLVTLTLDDEGQRRIAQYLLPIGHLVHHLSVAEREEATRGKALSAVQRLAQAIRAFRRGSDIRLSMANADWDGLLAGNWLDPMALMLAAYDSLRRGHLPDVAQAVNLLQAHFADLPDTAALARISGDGATTQAVPLLFDGLRAFPNIDDAAADGSTATRLPLKASHLDYLSAWTAWRGAV
jgi:Caspase domain